MDKNTLQLPKNMLLDILKYQPEDVLIELFDNLLVSNDTSPLSGEELKEVESAKKDYLAGNVIEWQG